MAHTTTIHWKDYGTRWKSNSSNKQKRTSINTEAAHENETKDSLCLVGHGRR